MSYLISVINWFTALPTSTWYHFGEFLLSGAGVSVVIKVITHVKEWHGKTTLLQSLVVGFSYVAVTAQSLVTSHIVNLSALGQTGAALAVAATFAYRLAVSPLYKRLVTLIEDAGVGAAAKAATKQPIDTFTV